MMNIAQQEFELRPTRPTANWPRRILWLSMTVLPVPLIATLAYAPLPGGRVTAANFRAIQIGMSISELRALLGVPRYESTELGSVSGPTSYAVNFEASDEELQARGFQVYARYTWISPQITITSIVDADGIAVCVYSAAGQARDLRSFWGGTTTQHLRPRANNRPQ